jgi:hypothetical protein
MSQGEGREQGESQSVRQTDRRTHTDTLHTHLCDPLYKDAMPPGVLKASRRWPKIPTFDPESDMILTRIVSRGCPIRHSNAPRGVEREGGREGVEGEKEGGGRERVTCDNTTIRYIVQCSTLRYTILGAEGLGGGRRGRWKIGANGSIAYECTALYSAVQYLVLRYIMMQKSIVRCISVQYSTVQQSIVQLQYSTVRYSIQRSIVRFSVVQYSTVRYSVILLNTAFYRTIQYVTVDLKSNEVHCSIPCSALQLQLYDAEDNSKVFFTPIHVCGAAQCSKVEYVTYTQNSVLIFNTAVYSIKTLCTTIQCTAMQSIAIQKSLQRNNEGTSNYQR